MRMTRTRGKEFLRELKHAIRELRTMERDALNMAQSHVIGMRFMKYPIEYFDAANEVLSSAENLYFASLGGGIFEIENEERSLRFHIKRVNHLVDNIQDARIAVPIQIGG